MKAVKFHPDAKSEMVAAAAYYEEQQPDLGRRFLASVQDAVNRISLNPRLYPTVELDVHRCLTKTFPFGVLFRERAREESSSWPSCTNTAILITGKKDKLRPPQFWLSSLRPSARL